MGSWVIRVYEEGRPPREVTLGEGMLIGRDPGCDCVLEDSQATSRHVRVRRRENSWTAEVVSDTRGILVSGKGTIHPHGELRLAPGLLVVVGRTRIEFLEFRDHDTPATLSHAEDAEEPTAATLASGVLVDREEAFLLANQEASFHVEERLSAARDATLHSAKFDHLVEEVTKAEKNLQQAFQKAAELQKSAELAAQRASASRKDAETAARRATEQSESERQLKEAATKAKELCDQLSEKVTKLAQLAKDAERRAASAAANLDSKAALEQRAMAEVEAKAAVLESAAVEPHSRGSTTALRLRMLQSGGDEGREADNLDLSDFDEHFSAQNQCPGLAERDPRLVIVGQKERRVVRVNMKIEDDCGTFVLGRRKKGNPGLVDCMIASEGVSAVHARILYCDGRFFLEDRASLNGSFVGDCRLKPNIPYEIFAEEHIRLGDLLDMLFVVRCDADGARISFSWYKPALDLMSAERKLLPEQMRQAEIGARDGDSHPAETLLLQGALSIKDWVSAMHRAEAGTGAEQNDPSGRITRWLVRFALVLLLLTGALWLLR